VKKVLALPLELVRHEPRLLARFIPASVGRAALAAATILLIRKLLSIQTVRQDASRVQRAIDRLVAGRLAATVAHRLFTLRNATRILVLSGERAVGLGTHHELLCGCEAYRILWEAQSGESARLPLRHAEAS
jgi:ATP-binding cassette subfamily B protein